MNLPPPLPVTKHLDHASVWQLVLGVIGLALTFLAALAVWALSLLARSKTGTLSLKTQNFPSMLWMVGFLALLAIPSIVYAARRLTGHTSRPLTISARTLWLALAALILWAGLLYVGNNATRWALPQAVLTPLNILVVAIPILLLLTVGLYRLRANSRQRIWGAITLTTFVTTEIVMLLELILIAIIAVAGIVWLSKQAEFAPYLNLLAGQKTLTESSLNSVLSQIAPLLNKPGVYAVVILVFCLFAPLIEEAFKPLGVWFLAGKQPSPTQGFTIGLICGATFGLLESLSLVNTSTGELWLYTVIARVGTGLLHTFTAGVSGWALAKTWQDRRYLRISLIYIGVVFLHGTWNLFAVLFGVSQLAFPINSAFLTGLMGVSNWVLYGLALLMLVGLFWMNIYLRRSSTPPDLPSTPSENTGLLDQAN